MDSLRKGNAMARARMMVVYDVAKELNALVCGTENKSEKYLAYFTRFGDEASDVEPIQHLYKTQVRQLAAFLRLPEQFITKAPSAGLWDGQTDEAELGFSYDQADQVIEGFLQEIKQVENITQLAAVTISQKTELDLPIVEAVLKRIKNNHFKHEVPYTIHETHE
jgi:NAD+ synthase